jgi:predicted CXXCH cytochrome family protein
VFQRASDSKVPHVVVTEDKACMNCHTPHGSPMGSLLADNPVNLCMRCHSEPLERPDGTPVGALHNMEDAKYKHGAVRLGRCRGCHEVHGSEHRSLLVHNYTPSFYQPFELDEYALCFQCHDNSLVTEKITTTATGFRNGDRNLHNVHVDSTDPPGRTCRACHATHTSNWPKLMRESVPYGEWQIPIHYKQTATGGGCAAGCHRAKSYDRVNPVNNP